MLNYEAIFIIFIQGRYSSTGTQCTSGQPLINANLTSKQIQERCGRAKISINYLAVIAKYFYTCIFR